MNDLKNYPVLFLLAFSVKALIHPDLNIALAIISTALLTGYCEYLKTIEQDKIEDKKIQELSNVDESIKADLENLKTKVASMQLARSFLQRA